MRNGSVQTSAPSGGTTRPAPGRHKLVLAFTDDVASGSAAITGGTGSVLESPAFAGKTMTGDADVQTITLTLTQVTNGDSHVLPDTGVSVNMLVGDTSGARAAKRADVRRTRAQVGVAVGASNFQRGRQADGLIDASDVGAVRSRLGNSLP